LRSFRAFATCSPRCFPTPPFDEHHGTQGGKKNKSAGGRSEKKKKRPDEGLPWTAFVEHGIAWRTWCLHWVKRGRTKPMEPVPEPDETPVPG